MRPLPQPWRYFRSAAGFFVLAVAGIVTGTLADAHHISGLSHLAAIVTGLALGLAIGMTARGYINGVRVPALGRQLTEMVQRMEDEQPVRGRFWAGLRDLGPRAPDQEDGNQPGSDDPFPLPAQPPRIPRWMRGRVVITPESVIWVRRMTGRARDLTGAEWADERPLDPGYTE